MSSHTQFEISMQNETHSETLVPPETHREGDGEVELDSLSDGDADPEDPDAPLKFRFNLRKLLRFMGPGWLMSLAYLDPGNLESDLQMGAYTGFSLVWVLWWATCVGLILQELSARLGVVTGRDLAQTVRAEYPRWLTWVVYVNMEFAVVASDIQEVVGSGIAINLLSNGSVPVWVGCVITGLDTFTFLAVHYLGVRYLEGLICVLIATMSGCFFVNWGETETDGYALARGWAVPSLAAYAVTQAVGAVGAVIMPHNLYLHSGLVLSRRVDRNSPRRVHEAICYNFIESGMALLCSFFINLAIVGVNAGSFFDQSCSEHPDGPYACISPDAFASSGSRGSGDCTLPGSGLPGKCGGIGLSGEGMALKHGIGESALYIWAVGLLAAGQASTMTATYAGQVIMGGCLEIQLAPWKRVAFTRVIALGPSIAIAAFTIDSGLYNDINEYLNVTQSLQLPFAMLPLLCFTAQFRIMGRFRSSRRMLAVNLLLAVLILAVNGVLVVQFCEGFSTDGIIAVSLYAVLYLFLCVCMVSYRRLYSCGRSGVESQHPLSSSNQVA